MTINEAHDAALNAVIQLAREGIEVRIKPSNGRNISSTVEKYGNREDRVTPDKWFNVTFTVDTPDTANAVRDKYISLCKKGITFDTGGCFGYRDWELDWSLEYVGTADGETEDRYDLVESLINKLGTGEIIDPSVWDNGNIGVGGGR